MRVWLKIISAVAVVVVSFLATLWAMEYWWPAVCYDESRLELKRPFNKTGGFSFFSPTPKFSTVSNNAAQPNRSSLKLCEDGRLVGPQHAPLDDISKAGRGRFTHWGEGIYFSASDNSDPNTNGRRYSVGP